MKSSPSHARLAALFAIGAAPFACGAQLDVARPEVQKFIAMMRSEHDFDPQDLVWVLRDVELQPRSLEIIQRPAEVALKWYEYRARFLTEERIAGGATVWQNNREVLATIERDTGVPARYLVAITGVETFYGRQTGSYRVLDALATLAFDYPRRADFFQKELAQFLLMTREERINPREPKGSYAGAMGIPQFMPSSFRAYAVDGSGDGRRDLWQYGPDVFASIANYFKVHGWRAGEPVLADALNDAPPDDPARAETKLADTVDSLKGRGYHFDTALPGKTPAMLVPAELEGSTAWRIGFQNFYVITRYNRSLLYAMAVNDLADAIATTYQASLATQGK
jgi:membrane-bound lytic murein transglycosylase B